MGEVGSRFGGPLSVLRKFVRSSIITKSSPLWEQLRVEYEKSMQAFLVVSRSVFGTGDTYFQKIFWLVFVYNSGVSAKLQDLQAVALRTPRATILAQSQANPLLHCQ